MEPSYENPTHLILSSPDVSETLRIPVKPTVRACVVMWEEVGPLTRTLTRTLSMTLVPNSTPTLTLTPTYAQTLIRILSLSVYLRLNTVHLSTRKHLNGSQRHAEVAFLTLTLVTLALVLVLTPTLTLDLTLNLTLILRP